MVRGATSQDSHRPTFGARWRATIGAAGPEAVDASGDFDARRQRSRSGPQLLRDFLKPNPAAVPIDL